MFFKLPLLPVKVTSILNSQWLLFWLVRGERQVCLLQKEKSELKARLADLRRGQAFLHDIRELNTQYLDYRRKHPKEKEMVYTQL